MSDRLTRARVGLQRIAALRKGGRRRRRGCSGGWREHGRNDGAQDENETVLGKQASSKQTFESSEMSCEGDECDATTSRAVSRVGLRWLQLRSRLGGEQTRPSKHRTIGQPIRASTSLHQRTSEENQPADSPAAAAVDCTHLAALHARLPLWGLHSIACCQHAESP